MNNLIEPGTDNELYFMYKEDEFDLSCLEYKSEISSVNIEPSYNLIFHNKNEEVGRLDFIGSSLKFTGDVDKSTESFMDFLCSSFQQRIDEIVEEKVTQRLSDKQEMINTYHNSLKKK